LVVVANARHPASLLAKPPVALQTSLARANRSKFKGIDNESAAFISVRRHFSYLGVPQRA